MSIYKQAVIELHYFPSVVWIAQLLRVEKLMLEAHEHFQKQSFRNRCMINSANGVLSLSIPTQGSPKQAIQAMRIDQTQRWQDRHWRSLYSAYGKAPFFEFFAEDLHALIYQKEDFLWNFNQSVLSKCLHCLQIKAEIGITEAWQETYEGAILDLRGQLTPRDACPPRFNFRSEAYYQVFGKDFVPYLSVLDLLFCEGTQAKHFLLQSIKAV